MNNNISDSLKETYNDYISISRSFNRKPFRIRKDFDKFCEDENYKPTMVLTKWFTKHPEINRKLFFEATMYFLKGQDYVPITEFIKTKAVTNYAQYCKLLDSMDLTNKKTLSRCVDSFKFIREFCKDKGISPNEYIAHKEPNSNFSFLIHIKQHRVCKYSLFIYDKYFSTLRSLYRDQEIWTHYLGEGDFSPFFLLKRWENSVIYKKVATAALNKINKQPTK